MKRASAFAAAALAVPALLAAPTVAAADTAQGTEVYRAQLEELNDSGATGTVKLLLRDNKLTVTIKARGLAPNLVHAQHIHGVGNSECPPSEFRGADGGVLTTSEGAPFYGPITASLTTSGDTSDAAGLAIDVMPVADARGRVDYKRTFTLPAGVARDLADFQVVQHGVDVNGNGAYDFSSGNSDIPGAEALPQEATAPANCGTISPVSHR